MAAPADDGYRVRRLTPADAPGVRALAQRVYGSTYFHDEVYDPDKLLRMNESGHLITAVAIDPADHVVGHYALERPDLEHQARSILKLMGWCVAVAGTLAVCASVLSLVRVRGYDPATGMFLFGNAAVVAFIVLIVRSFTLILALQREIMRRL